MTQAIKPPPKSELEQFYLGERLSCVSIGERYGVSNMTALKWLHEYGIQTRRPKEQKLSKCPPKTELARLYISDRLNTREIAEIFNVSHMSVKRWLRKYDIPRRDPGRGLIARGEQPPDAKTLARLVHKEHLTYAEIGSRYGVDYTAVTYWMDKHGIPRPSFAERRRKGRYYPPEPELRELYESGESDRTIGSLYEVSSTTVARWRSEFGIASRPSGFKGGIRYTCEDGHEVRSLYEQRVDDWLHARHIEHQYEPPLSFDRRMKADFLANGWYIEVWGVVDNRRYTERRKRKVTLYKQHQLPLIEIPVHAFDSSRNSMWERRLAVCLSHPRHISVSTTE